MAKYPKPPSGNLSGTDGKMLRQGSAGRLGWNPYENDDQDDAIGEQRRNVHEPDYFSGAAFSDDDEC